MTPKMFERSNTMFTTMVNKHADELREAHYDWYKLELYDARYNTMVEYLVPWCSLYWR